MTERNEWKPVRHEQCVYRHKCWIDRGFECTCSAGTRWSGYGERVGDHAAVYRLCQIYGAYRDADMADLIREMADDLRVYVAMEYPPETHNFPSQKRRFDQSMEVVHRAEAMLAAQQPKKV